MRKLFTFFLLTLLCLGLFGNFTPQATMVVAGSNFYEEITGLPFWARVVDVNSKGHIFVLSLDDDVWRSTDNGASWTKVLDDGKNWDNVINITTYNWLTLYIDSQDRIFTNLYGKTPPTFYRSIDNGESWQVIVTNSRRSWHMDEASNGTLYRHDFSYRWAAIYKSNDGGVTWAVFWNFTLFYGEPGWAEDLRTFAIDDYDDNKVWAATPFWIKYYNGSAWLTMNNDTTGSTWPSAFWFDNNYVYMGQELKRRSWRYSRSPTQPFPIPKTGSDVYWDPGVLTYEYDEHAFEGLRINDIMLFGIRSQLWGSCDGERWVKIVDLGSGVTSNIASISRRHPIYFTDRKQGKLYRLNIEGKEDLVRLFYVEFNAKRGLVTNAENYVLEQRIYNGTNYVDLTSVGLSNVQASIKGLSRTNYATPSQSIGNAGWEFGNTTGWYVFSGAGTYGVASVSTTDKANGTYSLKITKGASDTYDGFFRMASGYYVSVKKGDLVRASVYVKGNVSSTNRLIMYFNSSIYSKTFDLTTSWQRIDFWLDTSSWTTFPRVVNLYFVCFKGIPYEVFWDSIQVEKFEVGIIFSGGQNEDNVLWLEKPSPFFTTPVNTLNPNIAINGQTVSYSGTLTNGTESPATDLTGILTGTVRVEANIRGSGQAILRLTGTRVLYEDSIILRGRKDDVYYGRYYGAFSPTIATNDLVAVTNLQANITSLSYSANKLALTITSPSSSTSTTKVYVGDKGQPNNVTGAALWSYDSSTKILDITALHSSPTTIIVEWKLIGDINGDDTVNNQDLIILNQAFGSTEGPPPSPNWNPDADLNKDNNISILDLHALGKNYGKIQN